MVAVEAFGFIAVTSMVITYALEHRSHFYILAFAISCVGGSLYAILIHSWPFAIVEGIWAIIATNRWLHARRI